MRDLTRNLPLAGRHWRKIGRAAAARHGISEPASAPLLWIERLGGNVRQNLLADAIGIDGASLVRLLDELQTTGMVTRVPDPKDRRANVVNLTPAGRHLVGEVEETLNKLRLRVFAKLPREDIEAALRVYATLSKAAESIDELDP